ncbi:hypothetical protein [Coraliomargarita parva]|uniref:hypothetical protein n=1 Tax=Coraliomargarita parva TaxID=3014050 RepID=UPI0022B41C66|nr:hypothetical protein [Coraliomargarita parva]
MEIKKELPEPRSSLISATTAGTLVGILVTPVALLLSIMSAGAGHGNYLAAKFLYPYSMVSTYFFESIMLPFVVLAFVQYPVYGCLFGRAYVAKKERFAAWSVCVLHVVCVVLLYFHPPLYF